MADLEIGGKLYRMDSGNQMAKTAHAKSKYLSGQMFEYDLGDRLFIVLDWMPREDMTGLTTLEIAAGTGSWSLEMARLGAEHAVVVEPHPDNAEHIRSAAASEGLDAIEVIEAAVIPSEARKALLQERWGSPIHSSVWDPRAGAPIPVEEDVIEVSTVVLPSIMDRPDYLHLICPGGTIQSALEAMPDHWMSECEGCLGNWTALGVLQVRPDWNFETQVKVLQWYFAVWGQTHNVQIGVRPTAAALEPFLLQPASLAWSWVMTKKEP